MFCPNCGAEYREGFSECYDCQVPLVAALPPENHESKDYETIKLACNPVQIPILKSILEAEEIEHFFYGEALASLYPSMSNITSPPRLVVPLEDSDRVREILEEMRG